MFFLYGYEGDIILTVASRGIVSLLLPNGRTTRSKFAILVPTLENSTCSIHQALDKTLNDIMCMSNSDSVPFGGKVVVFRGDFRKILPIIPRGSRFDIVHVTINTSYLWDYYIVLKLTKSMHLQSNLTIINAQEIKRFSQWLIDVGDGKIGIDIQHNYKDEEFLKSKAILASTNEVVDQINDYILNIIPGEEKEYFSYDSIDMIDAGSRESYEVVTPKFLHSLKTSGMPNHKIRQKTGTPIMLIQNLDQMIRRQFSFIVSYAMTINKSQGQSLQNVGLYLPKPVFIHGQLYVAFSRVQSKSGLKILIHDKEGKPLNIMTNVVFKEVL
ncbi:hypothetical protein GYH30_055198 [Glycine max]|uniref:ATP-dependent DNA helicase n=1 Tax=Glycine max TaxID=3847 RepID=A0A0R0E8P6_SOYBN|nr:hypothetical protein GYH30_055198 [Glycine max]